MKKPIIAIVIVIVLGASLAWFKRVDVMLAVVKYKAQSRHTIAGNREVVWQGDASSTSAIAEPRQRRAQTQHARRILF